MPRWAILGSVLIHVGVAAGILYVARKGPEHATTVISVFEPAHPKPPPPKKAEEPKPPPPKPIVHQAEAPEPIAAPPPPPPAPIASQPPPSHAGGHPVALGGLQFGNGGDDSGPGLAVGGGGSHGVAVPESRLRTKQARSSSLAEDAPCLEEMTKPEPIFKPDIGYTDEARKSGIEGKLKLKFTIGSDGAVAKVDIVTSLDPGMDAAAVVTAMKWRFKPASRCGRSIAGGTYVWQGRFELGD